MSKIQKNLEAICLYKRLKLTRNLEAQHFTAAMTTDQSLKVRAQVLSQLPYMDCFRAYQLTPLDLDNRLEQQRCLSEGLLVVDPLRSNLAVGLLGSPAGELYLSINDLDHLRLTLTSYEESFDELWQNMDLLDDGLGQSLELSYLEPYGYLTSRIEQLGTGLNGEALLHLPALKKTGFIHALSESMGAIGVQVKPYKSDFYLVFNTVTLGRSEMELALLLDQVVEKISERERAGRETLWASEQSKLKDQIGRAYGLCRYSGQAEEEEAVQWLSQLLLGEGYGLLASVQSGKQTKQQWHSYLKKVSDLGIEAAQQKALSYRERMQHRGECLNEIHEQWQWRR